MTGNAREFLLLPERSLVFLAHSTPFLHVQLLPRTGSRLRARILRQGWQADKCSGAQDDEEQMGFRAPNGEPALQLGRQLQTLYRLLAFLYIYNNWGHLLFAQKLTPMAKTERVLTQFRHSSGHLHCKSAPGNAVPTVSFGLKRIWSHCPESHRSRPNSAARNSPVTPAAEAPRASESSNSSSNAATTATALLQTISVGAFVRITGDARTATPWRWSAGFALSVCQPLVQCR
jgi:hypothetical protein